MPNVYDFDDTISRPNSGIAFIKFCMRRHPELRRYLPRIGREVFQYLVNSRRGRPFKAEYYIFVPDLPDWREEVRLFWEANAETMLRPWYLAQKRPDDIIVSDSTEFLLQPLCERLGVRLLATRVDTATGLIEGYDCYGPEKPKRLFETFGPVEIEEFYSDSLHDAPLAALAQRAWLVKGDERVAWPEKKRR